MTDASAYIRGELSEGFDGTRISSCGHNELRTGEVMPIVEPTLLAAHIRCMVAAETDALMDVELVDRFAENRDAGAFEVLVWRHGPMVWGTCRRILRHQHDIEDAFQATFLALARTAKSIGTRQAISGWLHRVAVNAALKLKANRVPAEPLADVPARSDVDSTGGELAGVLDEELNRLSDRTRAAFVLCCLEGMTSAEVARELGCPVGTVDSRLHAARARLRDRLARRGFGPGRAGRLGRDRRASGNSSGRRRWGWFRHHTTRGGTRTGKSSEQDDDTRNPDREGRYWDGPGSGAGRVGLGVRWGTGCFSTRCRFCADTCRPTRSGITGGACDRVGCSARADYGLGQGRDGTSSGSAVPGGKAGVELRRVG